MANNFGWDLPPGCTAAHINTRFGIEEEYEFVCSAPDCAEAGHNREDFLACDSCNRLICAEHKHSPALMPYLHFCADCFKCARCGELAMACCEECGDLRCAAHIVQVETESGDDGWEYCCDSECLSKQHKSVQRVTEMPAREGAA